MQKSLDLSGRMKMLSLLKYHFMGCQGDRQEWFILKQQNTAPLIPYPGVCVYPVCDVIVSLRTASLKNECVCVCVRADVVLVGSGQSGLGSGWDQGVTVRKYLGLLQLHLGISFFNDIRILTLSLQGRHREMTVFRHWIWIALYCVEWFSSVVFLHLFDDQFIVKSNNQTLTKS